MVNIDIPNNLYDDFVKEKESLDSTLSTIEILKDRDLVKEIEVGLEEIDEGNSKTLKFDDIDSL